MWGTLRGIASGAYDIASRGITYLSGSQELESEPIMDSSPSEEFDKSSYLRALTGAISSGDLPRFEELFSASEAPTLSDLEKKSLYNQAMSIDNTEAATKISQQMTRQGLQELFLEACQTGNVAHVNNLKERTSIRIGIMGGLSPLLLGFYESCKADQLEVFQILQDLIGERELQNGIELACARQSLDIVQFVFPRNRHIFKKACSQGLGAVVNALKNRCSQQEIKEGMSAASWGFQAKVIDILIENYDSNYVPKTVVSLVFKTPYAVSRAASTVFNGLWNISSSLFSSCVWRTKTIASRATSNLRALLPDQTSNILANVASHLSDGLSFIRSFFTKSSIRA